MRRLSHDEVRMNMEIQITCLRGPTKTALQAMRGDSAVKEAARIIMERCLAGTVILAPDMVGNGNHGDRPGTFGVDEPWPFEPGHKPPK